MSLFTYQLKQAYSGLKQKPGFVFSVVSTMGITLGALLCVLTLNYLLLLEPLPYPEQERIFVAQHHIIDAKKETQKVAFSYPGLVELYKSRVAFEQSAMLYYSQDVITSHRNQPLVNTTYVTPELHQILASPMALGRMFEASEALNTNSPVAMLSYVTWQQAYEGRADILHLKINIRGVSYQVIGVLAENFVEPELAEIGRETQVWLPWDFNVESAESRYNFGNIQNNFHFIGQLKKSVNQSQAQQLITPLVSELWQEKFVAKFDFFQGWSVDMRVRSVKNIMLGESKSFAVMLLAGIVGLVLIACANIANLFMSRTAEKHRQMSIQAAIGATKKQLFSAMLAETSLLMLMAIIFALVIAKTGFYLMQQYLGALLPRVNELSLNLITFGSALLITAILALFFAKLTTNMINYRGLNTTLQSSGKGSGLQVSKKTRQILIASQVALATLLVFANISLLKNAMRTINAPIGFSTNNISTLVLNLSSTQAYSQEDAIPTMAEIMTKLEALPQVESVAQGNSPLGGFGIKALTKSTGNKKYTPYFKRVDQRYFNMIEQPLLQGENFTIIDRRDNNNKMIVNQAFAQQLKADGAVIGMLLPSIGEPDFKIVGIVKDITIPGDTAFGSDDTAASVPRVYAPSGLSGRSFMLKFKPGQSVSRQQLAALLAKIDSRYSVFSFNKISDNLNQRLFTEITTAIATAMLALITFLLAGIGLYGILSYSTQMRRLELGTRMAVGAKRHDLTLMIIKDNVNPIVLGVLLSLITLVSGYFFFIDALSFYITSQLIPMFAVTIFLISSLSLLVCYLPLRKIINLPAINSLRGTE
ncbi:ABC transporter permease [Cognaticolwellia mytili]|uniref:ABC transporter permease n=1 Tax=Cognaticolwellia mytili TaxID=1888913 RepID=UPI000A177D5F|nr:ABC transporter permease [Cognaticolwellia mytili]